MNLNLSAQAILALSALVLLTSFALMAQSRLTSAIHSFAWQGLMISAISALIAFDQSRPHLYISSVLSFSLKTILIPWMLHRLVRRLNMERLAENIRHPARLLLISAALVIFSYWVALPIERLSSLNIRNIIAISLSVVLIGLWVMIARRQAIIQVLAFMSIENGLFLAAIASTGGMPLIVELGIAFDVLIAAILFGVFFFHISESIGSLDVDQLNRLKEEG